jgi:hypothetical protein
MEIELMLISLLILSGVIMQIETSMATAKSNFDMNGTIANVLSPSSFVVDNVRVKLNGVDASSLNWCMYSCLLSDLKQYYTGKDVFVEKNNVYLDLLGSYNSESINEHIQKEIESLMEEQDHGALCCPEFDCHGRF